MGVDLRGRTFKPVLDVGLDPKDRHQKTCHNSKQGFGAISLFGGPKSGDVSGACR